MEDLTPYAPLLGKMAPIVVIISMLLGFWCKHGLDAWRRWQKGKMEDAFDLAQLDLMTDEKLKDGFKFALRKQDRQITRLEARCDMLQAQHSECLEEQARNETTIKYIREDLENTKGELDASRKRIDAYREELRLFRRQDPFPSPGLREDYPQSTPLTEDEKKGGEEGQDDDNKPGV